MTRVGLTNGCFDLLHHGHVNLLEAAKAQCDFLIVAVDSDENVSRIKGEGRPFQPLKERMVAILRLDYGRAFPCVIPFHGSPAPLICAIRPDVLFKGDDRPAEEIAGANLLKEWGGELVLIRRTPGISTTEAAYAKGLLSRP